jgi:hypothetical protein
VPADSFCDASFHSGRLQDFMADAVRWAEEIMKEIDRRWSGQ